MQGDTGGDWRWCTESGIEMPSEIAAPTWRARGKECENEGKSIQKSDGAMVEKAIKGYKHMIL